MDVQMLSDEAPNTVANFLGYVNRKAYNASIIHRSTSIATDGIAVIQGGGYYDNVNLSAITAGAAINNEFSGTSNLRGTLAMALIGGEPNSATDQWFFNTTDNSAALDPQDFTVFGQVANNASLAVMDALQAVPVPSPPVFSSPFDEMPLYNYTSGATPTLSNLVEVDSIVTENAPASATATLGGLAALFTNTAHAVTVTTSPAHLAAVVTYNGLLTAPTAVGSYSVLAVISSAGYQGSATGTLVISAPVTKVKATVTLGSLTATYNGSPHAATATTNPAGLTVNFTYNGSSTVPTAAGKYTVVGTINDPDFQGSATGTLVISKATAAVALTNLSATYDGTPHAAGATTTPTGLAVTFTYTRSATVPTNAGSYAVVGTVNDPNYVGTASGTLVIAKASGTVSLTPSSLAATYTGKAIAPAVTTVPAGLPVKFAYTQNGKTASPINVGSYAVTATINSPNSSAGTTSGTLVISPASATVTLGNLSAVYTGRPIAVTVTTVPAKLAVSILYNGSAAAPTAVNSYPVSATITNPNYTGSASGTLVISQPVVFATTPQTPLLSASGAQVGFGVDPGGVATTVYFEYSTDPNFGTYSQTATQTIGAGKVQIVVSGFLSDLQASTTYYYKVVTVSAAGTFAGPVESLTTLAFDTTLVAKTGDTAPGTSGATYDLFGDVAINNVINDGNGVAFAASLNLSAANPVVNSLNDLGIWATQGTNGLSRIVQANSTAPDTTSATFQSFGDPVYNENNQVAFGGQLNVVSGQATSATSIGVWSTSSGALHLVGRQGDPAPGYNGATLTAFSTFDALALSDAKTLIFATLATGTGVGTSSNFGIWEGTQKSDLALKLRTGDSVGGKTIYSLTLTSSEALLEGVTRDFASNTGDLAALASFTDGTTGIVTSENGVEALAESTASAVPDANGNPITGAAFATFSSPIINDSDHLAFAATLALGSTATSATNTGIWADSSTGMLELVARTGQTGTEFLSLSDPLDNNNDATAFSATYKSGTTTVTGLFCNSTGAVTQVAQTGGQPPGCPTGVKFSAFNAMALADAGGATNKGGLVFEATVTGTGVTTANNTGIWAVDNTGTLQLIVRTGDALNVAPNGTPIFKTISLLAFLPYSSVLDGQTRGVAKGEGLAYTVTFSDKSNAIFNVVFP